VQEGVIVSAGVLAIYETHAEPMWEPSVRLGKRKNSKQKQHNTYMTYRIDTAKEK